MRINHFSELIEMAKVLRIAWNNPYLILNANKIGWEMQQLGPTKPTRKYYYILASVVIILKVYISIASLI